MIKLHLYLIWHLVCDIQLQNSNFPKIFPWRHKYIGIKIHKECPMNFSSMTTRHADGYDSSCMNRSTICVIDPADIHHTQSENLHHLKCSRRGYSPPSNINVHFLYRVNSLIYISSTQDLHIPAIAVRRVSAVATPSKPSNCTDIYTWPESSGHGVSFSVYATVYSSPHTNAE